MKFKFPTKHHEKIFNSCVDFFKSEPDVLALTLICSCARGEGSPDSDIDLEIFANNPLVGEEIIERFSEFSSKFEKSAEVGRFFHVDVHLGFTKYMPVKRGWTDAPDEFELRIGNSFIYSQLVFEKDGFFTKAKEKYLPYYDEELRQAKLKEGLKYCENNIGHIEPMVKRGLYFHAFSRLFHATQEFLQALFISKKVYPIAYDKWIKKQIVEILELPELYKEFVSIHEIKHLESDELIEKGKKLQSLIDKYIN
jgi:predicted nucleotidyltransferase